MKTKNPTHIAFTTDKRGQRIAYREGWNRRYFRMAVAEAEVMLATGAATRVPFVDWTVR